MEEAKGGTLDQIRYEDIVVRQTGHWRYGVAPGEALTPQPRIRGIQDARVVQQAPSERRGRRGHCQDCALARDIKWPKIRTQRQINFASWFVIDLLCTRCTRRWGCTWRQVLFLLMTCILGGKYLSIGGGDQRMWADTWSHLLPAPNWDMKREIESIPIYLKYWK